MMISWPDISRGSKDSPLEKTPANKAIASSGMNSCCRGWFIFITRHLPAMVQAFFVLILVSILLLMEFSGTPGMVQADEEVLRVGSELEFPPYAFVDPTGRPDGFSVELVQAVAEVMGLPIEIITGSWDTVWKDLAAGKLDLLPLVAKLPERAQLVDFSIPHTETFDAFFVRQGDRPIRDINEASTMEIVVMRSDAAHHALLERNFPGHFITVTTIPEGLSLVASGRHDAFLCSKLIGTIAMKKHRISGLMAGPPIPDYKRVFSFAVKKGDHELLEKLNQGLLIIKTNGMYDQLYDKWLSADDPWRRFRKYFLPGLGVISIGVILVVLWSLMLQLQVKKRTRELAETNVKLNRARNELEGKVAQRTEELTRVNNNLQDEISERIQVETDREQLLEELARSNKELEQFAYMASHDLKEPLRTIISFVQLLQKRYGDELDERADQYMDLIVDGAGRMQKLIEGLLSYSRIDLSREGFKRVDVNKSFDEALANLKPVIEENMAKVTRENLPVVAGDEMQLIQLLQNLISNSIKYRQPEIAPQVHVSVEEENGTWLFKVQDNGIGIEPQYFEQIFQIFQRLHTQEEYPGTGIGLTLCKRIVERHRGRIWVESAPNKGTTFLFTIPVFREYDT